MNENEEARRWVGGRSRGRRKLDPAERRSTQVACSLNEQELECLDELRRIFGIEGRPAMLRKLLRDAAEEHDAL